MVVIPVYVELSNLIAEKAMLRSLDYEMSVDLWFDIIAMEYPFPHVLCLLLALFLIENRL